MSSPSAVDPLVAQGPTQPVDNLRPAISLQRLLVIKNASAMMADLASGDIRPWENGPPVSVPALSAPFTFDEIGRLQIQMQRDPRPASTESVLVSMVLAGRAVDIIESTARQLVIREDDAELASRPIGVSPAIVIVIEPDHDESTLRIRARNAETTEEIGATVRFDVGDKLTLTLGGPSTSLTGTYGRRRTIPVLVDVHGVMDPIDQVRRTLSAARRMAGSIKRRVR